MNPIFVTTEGAALEDVQSAVETAEHNAASEKHYKNGFAADRRGRVPPTRATRGGRGARNGSPPMRFEGPAGAAWYMNPAWWIAGAVIYLAWRKK